MSVVLPVKPLDGWAEAVALPDAKEPPEERDSAARESEVTVPADSVLGFWEAGSDVT